MLNTLLPRNEHIADRVFRVVIGIIAIAMVFVGPKTAWGLLGLIPLVTGLVGSCPIYRIIGRGTCAIAQQK